MEPSNLDKLLDALHKTVASHELIVVQTMTNIAMLIAQELQRTSFALHVPPPFAETVK